MRANHIPNQVQAKLDAFERTVEHLTQQLAKTQAAIAGVRQRLSGGFQKDQEYRDLRASLDQMVKDLPAIENKLDAARYTLTDARAFLAALPDDAVLEPVAQVKPNGIDLDTVQRRIDAAKDEIARLRAVPLPSPDIEERIREYMAALARPQVSGIGTGQRLQVRWPDDVISVLALLLPDEMVNALLREVERVSNRPMPLPQRKRRIAQLQAEIDTLQRQALALGAGTSALPPAVVLGVRIAETKATRAA
jgi:septal ring factor EnvC (AmiA/AmiB activator)